MHGRLEIRNFSSHEKRNFLSSSGHVISSILYLSHEVSYFQRSPITRHRRVHASPVVCKLFFTLFSKREFGQPVPTIHKNINKVQAPLLALNVVMI